MKRAYFIPGSPYPSAHIHPCRIEGCDGLGWDTDICNRCAEEIAVLNHHYAAGEDRRVASRPANRLRDFAYVVAVVGLMAWIMFEFSGFILDTLTLWFGGK